MNSYEWIIIHRYFDVNHRISYILANWFPTNGRTDQRTDGRTNGVRSIVNMMKTLVFLIIGHFSSKVFFSFPFEFDIDLELICKKVMTFEIDIELSPPDRSFSLRINMHFSSSVRRLGPKQPRINDYCATPSQHDGGSIGIPSQRVASWHYNSRFSRWSVFKNRGLLLE